MSRSNQVLEGSHNGGKGHRTAGPDAFQFDVYRQILRKGRRRGIWAVTAGPIGFSTAWLVFSPDGMTSDRYFDLHDRMDRLDQLVAFAVGLTPRATHLSYMDLGRVNVGNGAAPSAALACQLASGVAATEAVRILVRRGGATSAPWYRQFDAYRQVVRKGRLWGGNRHPWQRIKRWLLARRFRGRVNATS